MVGLLNGDESHWDRIRKKPPTRQQNPKYPPCFVSVESRGPTFHHIRLVHRLAPTEAQENAVFLGHGKAGRIT